MEIPVIAQGLEPAIFRLVTMPHTTAPTRTPFILVMLCFTLYIFIHSYSKPTFYMDVGISQLFIVSPTCFETAGRYKGVRYKTTSVDTKSLLIRSRKNDTFTDTTVKRYVNRGLTRRNKQRLPHDRS